jgi:hypothetical protein
MFRFAQHDSDGAERAQWLIHLTTGGTGGGFGGNGSGGGVGGGGVGLGGFSGMISLCGVMSSELETCLANI